MRLSTTLAAAVLAMGASAQENYLGFNTGANKADRSAKFKADFKQEFETAAKLNGAPGKFNAARLYTNIQAYSDEDPSEAFAAALETNTKLLLGIWASGTDNIDKEISALKKALQMHKGLADLVIGINIGSEDLYRVSATGVKNKSGVGNSPDAIVGFIDDYRKAFKDGPLADVPVGHADTWDVWGNSTNKPVIDAVDFISVHEYPYYENDKGNHIDNAAKLFEKAYQATKDAAGDKPIWVTETGWPYVGPKWDEAVASTKNAEKYWKEVGCKKLFNKTPTFWYTLRDSNPDNEMKFAITEDLSTEPRFDLSCKNVDKDDDDEKDDKDDKKGGDKRDEDEDDEDHKDGKSGKGPYHHGSNSTTTMATPTHGSGSAQPTGGIGGSGGNGGSGDGAADDGETPPDAASSLKMSAVGMLAVVAGALALF